MKPKPILPYKAVSPSRTIKREMKERGMRVKDLADEIGHTAFATKKILDGSRRIDDHFAKALANVFGTTSDFWVSLERNFQRALRGE